MTHFRNNRFCASDVVKLRPKDAWQLALSYPGSRSELGTSPVPRPGTAGRGIGGVPLTLSCRMPSLSPPPRVLPNRFLESFPALLPFCGFGHCRDHLLCCPNSPLGVTPPKYCRNTPSLSAFFTSHGHCSPLGQLMVGELEVQQPNSAQPDSI